LLGRLRLPSRNIHPDAQGATIALNVLVMNLEKPLELLFVLFAALLRLLLVNEGSRSIRTVPLKPQKAAA
jgi:IS5 family transposase